MALGMRRAVRWLSPAAAIGACFFMVLPILAEPPAPLSISPMGPEVRVLPIDLPTALRLADSSNPTISFARERVREAYAHLREADVLWLPNLQTGPSYVRHDGIVQNATGLVFPTSKWNF